MCSKARRPDLVRKIRPVDLIGLAIQNFFVAKHAFKRGVGHVRPVRHDDDLQIVRKMRAQLFNDRYEGEVDKQEPVLGVIDDVDHLLSGQARIDRVADRPDAGNGIVKLKMPVAIPRERGHPIPVVHTKPLQSMRQLGDPSCRFPVGCAMNITFRAHRNDLA